MCIWVSFGAISLKYCSSLSPFNFIKQKAWFKMFSQFIRNQTYRFSIFLHFSLAIHRNLRNWHQLFYFHFFGLLFPWKYWLPLKAHSTKLQSFSNNWCKFHIDEVKGRLVKRQTTVSNHLNRTTITANSFTKIDQLDGFRLLWQSGWENSARSRNQSDCRICWIPSAEELRKRYKRYYMPARGYEFYLRVFKSQASI